MADSEKQSKAQPTASSPKADAGRVKVFNWTPSPWEELRKLEYGADHTFANTVQKLVFAAEPEEFAALEKRLIAVLKDSKSTRTAQEFTCRLLALIGSEACVDALSPLLVDEKMTHPARLALQPILGEKADAALRSALSKLKGNAKAGLIGTLGVRASDRTAAPLLASILNDTAEPAIVREAATLALARLQINPNVEAHTL